MEFKRKMLVPSSLSRGQATTFLGNMSTVSNDIYLNNCRQIRLNSIGKCREKRQEANTCLPEFGEGIQRQVNL